VPFRTAHGRRVFSGGFQINATPLGAYLRSSLPYRGAELAIVDDRGRIVLGSVNGASAVARQVLRGARSRSGFYVTEQSVSGAPWKIVALVPESSLYAPLGGLKRVTPWIVFAGFALAAAASLLLLFRLTRRREELMLLAATDTLTGVCNRRALTVEYDKHAVLRARYGGPLLDIDNFRSVNDHLGHAAGDELLRRVADAMCETLRASDIVARVGGDEFTVLLPVATPESAQVVRTKLQIALTRVFSEPAFDGLDLGVSIGVAVEGATTAGLDVLLSDADHDMYQLKDANRSRGSRWSIGGPGALQPRPAG
jgi:diguanylate cyclase (GGDEF)-like protein